ncbi:hypothetical protein LTV02_19350 [Nocardia yamanashiensis]|uniref:hypothetical protein n=1 Tax=Nocardia yamanashiensis TaxID=209247 RepID=UPI001E3745A8|nr:hypothetical protein [Nocardia yamanashiensis]UGT45410.1 hypothetical protein LTV02_19350 [Nocardia yamanashiensis]
MSAKRFHLAAAVLGTALLLTACEQGSNYRDLKGIPGQEPDSVTMYINVDQHPNLAKVCIDGIAFMTTSRLSDDAVTRVPEWDKTCPTPKTK